MSTLLLLLDNLNLGLDRTAIGTVTSSRWGAELAIAWTSSGPPGAIYQVYLNRQLVYHGPGLSCVVPWPSRANTRIDVGMVDPADATTDFSGTLPPLNDQVTLAWLGGTYEAPDLAGYRVYASAAPNGPVDYTTVLADITAYPGGIVVDGWGMGPWNQGGWGTAASNFAWTSGRLASGTWTFAVRAYDVAQNEESVGRVTTATIVGPPRPPAADASGIRLSYTYNPATHVATLNWLASPG